MKRRNLVRWISVWTAGFLGFVVGGAGPAAGQTKQADSVTTTQLSVWAYAVDYQNNPVPGVELRYEIAGTQTQVARERTAKDGGARLTGTAQGQTVRAEVDDASWYSTDGIQEGKLGGAPIVFRVFPSSQSNMSRDERIAMHRARIRSLLEQRKQAAAEGGPLPDEGSGKGTKSGSPSGLGGTPPKGQPPSVYDDPVWGYKTNKHIISFVAGMRVEDTQGIVNPEDHSSTYSTEADLMVINGLGHPVPDVIVELFELKAGDGSKITVADTGRTNAAGKVIFQHLDPRSWFRAECQTEDGQIGRSTVFQVWEGQDVPLRAIVIRPEDQMLSGFVLRSGGPARYAKIILLDPSGNPSLSTMADVQGYFVLGPVKPGGLTLKVSHFDPSPVDVTLPIPAERELPEILAPLDALARDRGTTPPQGTKE